MELAVAHLQVQLASIAGFDGKLMFLTALNVAGISALVGIAASADPALWLLGFGSASSAICVLLGLGDLWFGDVAQFPTPAEAKSAAREEPGGDGVLAWRYAEVVRDIAESARDAQVHKIRLMRLLLIGTSASLGLVIATALTATKPALCVMQVRDAALWWPPRGVSRLGVPERIVRIHGEVGEPSGAVLEGRPALPHAIRLARRYQPYSITRSIAQLSSSIVATASVRTIPPTSLRAP